MAGGVDVRLEGDERLIKRLARFERTQLKRTLNKAARVGARVYVAPLKQKLATHKVTGTLYRSVGIRTLKRGDQPGVYVSASPKKAPHRHLFFGPVKAHDIVARGGFLSFLGIGAQRVRHPGTAGHPFISEVAAAERHRAYQTFADAVVADTLKVRV